MKGGTIIYDKYLNPQGAQMYQGTVSPKIIPWEFSAKQGIQGKKVRASNGQFANLKALTVGTLTLGGTQNGSGILKILDASGVQQVTEDNTGITINNGKITIQNDSSQTTLDAKGIVSNSNNFVLTNTTNGGINQSFTTTSYVDVTGSSVTFTLGRTATILILATSDMFLVESIGNTCDGTYAINIDGTNQFNTGQINSGMDFLTSSTVYSINSLAGGSHTIKLQAKLITVYAGSPSMTIKNFSWSYIILGT